MAKLRHYQNPKMWEDQPAGGVGSFGVISEVSGEIFVDETPLLAYLKDYLGHKGMFEFVFPEEAEYEIDAKILPLVRLLQSKGLYTMGSCEAHFPAEKNFNVAYVAFHLRRSDNKFLDKLYLKHKVPDGWTVEPSQHHSLVHKLTVTKRANSAEELKEQHKLIEAAIAYYEQLV